MFQGAAALNLDAKGRMAVPAKHRDALSSPADGRLVVEVSNEGEPLPPDFELGATNSLGLSIVTTLVDDLGGEFTLTSDESGPGTVARVSIPLG